MRSRDAKGAAACAVVVGLALLAAVTAAAPASAQQSQEASINVPVGGLQVAIDPHTGQLRPPTPEEAQALARELARLFAPAVAGPKATVHADGTIGMPVGNEHWSFYLVRAGAGGQLESACVDGVEAAADFLSAASTAAAAAEDR